MVQQGNMAAADNIMAQFSMPATTQQVPTTTSNGLDDLDLDSIIPPADRSPNPFDSPGGESSPRLSRQRPRLCRFLDEFDTLAVSVIVN